MTRVDKADILELTVAHLAQQKQQRHQREVAMATSTSASGYSNGYHDCTREVFAFLATNSLVDGATLDCLGGYLQNVYAQKSSNVPENTRTNPELYSSTPMRPYLRVQKQLANANLSGFSPIVPSPSYQTVSPAYQNISDIRGDVRMRQTDGSTSYSSRGSAGDIGSCSSMEYSSGVTGSVSGVSSATSSGESYDSSGLVTIGDGKENAIGHVIKDSTWRPW